jgi:Protein of unknown function (DUF3297)
MAIIAAHHGRDGARAQPSKVRGLKRGRLIPFFVWSRFRTENRFTLFLKPLYEAAMNDDTPQTPTPEILPDRLSTSPQSPFHDAALLERGIGVKFNGVDRNNVEEYCVSEGWVRLAVGKTVDRHGNAMTVKYKGVVEPYFR